MASARNKVREKAVVRKTAAIEPPPEGPAPLLQPRAVVAAVQSSRPRGGAEREPSAARAAAFSVDLRVEPRRVLHGARRRHLWPGGRRRADALAGRPDAAAAVAHHQPFCSEPRRRQAVLLAHPQVGDGAERHAYPRGRGSEAGREELAAAPLPHPHLPHPDADRRRSGAPVPVHSQPGPHHGRGDAARQR